MKVTKNILPKKQVELIIEVSPEELAPYLENAAKQIAETKKIPGFRPGKAPYQLVVQSVGEMAIYQAAANDAIAGTYYEAVDQEKLETIDQPTVEVVKLAPGNAFIYKATASLVPNVEVCDLAKVKIEKSKEIVVEPAEIEKTLADLKKMRAKEVLTDKAAEKGDKVELDFDAYLDNVTLEGGSAKKHTLIVGEGQMIPGFEDQLIGLKAGETKEFELAFPKEYHAKHLAGKLTTFKIKLNAVFKIELPELNDEFAKTLGMKDFENLQKNIESNLKLEKQAKETQRLELKIIEKLCEKCKFDELPEALITQETHKMVHELEDNISKQGMKFEDYLSHMKKTEAELMLDFVPEAIKRVHTALMMRKIAEQEKIEISENEVEEEIEKALASYKLHPAYANHLAELEKSLHSDNGHQYFHNFLTNRKTMLKIKEIVISKE